MPGVSVADVARRHGTTRWQVETSDYQDFGRSAGAGGASVS
jgi:hypothetical protein